MINENGTLRHTLTLDELTELYRKIDNFIADCTEEEAKTNKSIFIAIKTLVHQRMRSN